MNIQKTLSEYDSLFGNHTLTEIQNFLSEKTRQAEKEGDNNALLSLLNEQMGLCRDTGARDLALDCAERMKRLLIQMQPGDTAVHGTTLLNIANAYRAFELFDESHALYLEAERIYQASLPKNDFLFASLYNNWSLLSLAQQDYGQAVRFLRQALQIVSCYPDAAIQQATTMTNLANSLMQQADHAPQTNDAQPADFSPQKNEIPPIDSSQQEKSIRSEGSEQYKEAAILLEKALEIFKQDGGQDFHYSAALSAMGKLFYHNAQYEESSAYYLHAMEGAERHTGKSPAWKILDANYQEAKRKAHET